MFDNLEEKENLHAPREVRESQDFAAILAVEVLNISIFRDLRESIDDDLVFSDLITVYLNSAETLVEEIQNAFAKQDIHKLGMSAHSLKSTSASIGAMQLSQVCRYLEKYSKNEEVPISKSWIDLLTKAYGQMNSAIKSCIFEFMEELRQ